MEVRTFSSSSLPFKITACPLTFNQNCSSFEEFWSVCARKPDVLLLNILKFYFWLDFFCVKCKQILEQTLESASFDLSGKL